MSWESGGPDRTVLWVWLVWVTVVFRAEWGSDGARDSLKTQSLELKS